MISLSFSCRKLLVNDTPTTEDLEGIDYSLVNSMELLRTIETTGVTSETFSSIFFETFTTTTSDDRVIDLKPNGAAIEVTWENRQEYCDLVLQVSLYSCVGIHCPNLSTSLAVSYSRV